MNKTNAFSRRKFLWLSAFGSGSVWFFSSCSGNQRLYLFFTDEESSLVESLSEQIIPPDKWPGAREAGVPEFIDKQLFGPYHRFQDIYRKSLTAIKEICQLEYSGKFEELEWHQQFSFMERMEAGSISWKAWTAKEASDFFALFRDHCMQGYYGSPRHGGNKNYISYRMLGIDYPLIIGQNRYK